MISIYWDLTTISHFLFESLCRLCFAPSFRFVWYLSSVPLHWTFFYTSIGELSQLYLLCEETEQFWFLELNLSIIDKNVLEHCTRQQIYSAITTLMLSDNYMSRNRFRWSYRRKKLHFRWKFFFQPWSSLKNRNIKVAIRSSIRLPALRIQWKMNK